MPRVHVCPLPQVAATVAAAGASHLVSLINRDTPVDRPTTIPAENHLFLGLNDILEPSEGMVTPAAEHVETLLGFVRRWDRRRAIVIHCYAGISRSTAGAFITLCALAPNRAEADIARRLRSASPYATPNARLVGFADDLLGREGRMVSAIAAIGRGETAYEGIPFSLPVAG